MDQNMLIGSGILALVVIVIVVYVMFFKKDENEEEGKEYGFNEDGALVPSGTGPEYFIGTLTMKQREIDQITNEYPGFCDQYPICDPWVDDTGDSVLPPRYWHAHYSDFGKLGDGSMLTGDTMGDFLKMCLTTDNNDVPVIKDACTVIDMDTATEEDVVSVLNSVIDTVYSMPLGEKFNSETELNKDMSTFNGVVNSMGGINSLSTFRYNPDTKGFHITVNIEDPNKKHEMTLNAKSYPIFYIVTIAAVVERAVYPKHKQPRITEYKAPINSLLEPPR